MQVELYTIARMDERRSSGPEAVRNEVWSWRMGPNRRHWAAAWQNDAAAQQPNPAPAGTAVIGRCVGGDAAC